MYWPFYRSGFEINGVDQVNYQHQQSLTFNCVYLGVLGLERFVTWEFTKSTDHSLIGTSSGASTTVYFDLSDGKDGIDVQMNIQFGIIPTKFKKKRRVVITPDFTAANRTIDISTIPILSGGSAFSNAATASVTNGSSNVTTSAAHGASVGDIVVFIKDGVSRTYLASTGTSGTTIVLDRSYEGITGTVTNGNTRRGINIQHQYNASAWNPGDIVHLVGKLYTARCSWINANGDVDDEIWMTNNPANSNVCEFVRIGGSDPTLYDDVFQLRDLCSNLRIIGLKDGSGNYRLRFTDGGFSAQHFSIGNTSDHHNIRLSGIRVINARSTGIKPKLDSVNRVNGAWYDCWVYDNWIKGSGNEGIYMGYFRYTFDPSFNGGDYHHAMKRPKCFANYVEDSQWDAIQLSGSDEGAECFYNFMKNNALEQEGSQNFGAVMNGGWKGHFYNNIIIGNTVQCLPYGDTYIYNNLIYNTTYGNALFLRRGDNPNLGSPVFNPYDPTAVLYMWNNILTSLQDTIYILDQADQGGPLVPMAELWIVNNVLCYTGTAIEGYIRYNEPAGGQVRTLTPNIQTLDETQIQFNDYADDDVRLKDTSIVFSSSDGADVSAKLSASDLPLGMFTDLSDQIIPERGFWKQACFHDHINSEAQLAAEAGRSQMQWFQTAQTSTFSDKERIPRCYGAIVNKMNVVGGSAKPRYVLSVQAWPNTGTKSTETIKGPSYL